MQIDHVGGVRVSYSARVRIFARKGGGSWVGIFIS